MKKTPQNLGNCRRARADSRGWRAGQCRSSADKWSSGRSGRRCARSPRWPSRGACSDRPRALRWGRTCSSSREHPWNTHTSQVLWACSTGWAISTLGAAHL